MKKCQNVTTTDLVNKLGEYENTELEPKQVRELIRKKQELEDEKIDLLNQLEHAKEQIVALSDMAFN